ncbi:formylglycine-generating enzyme family protein [Methylogaea oryzae]|uniref:formylglycine-generating enzyme family protein n=1 Tax=Methylogaea oryzae TaxID=1295382 RepID=UPI0009E7BA28|nr:SUMF1/EgtB/PvdO family nonheme iron enzyme [Methylogaea oryzae]
MEERAGRDWQNPALPQSGNHPAVCVSWEDANAYIRWLNGKTGRHYRLPTEAEWEYAAKAGTAGARYWGNSESRACRYANVADHSTERQTDWHVDDPFHCDDGYIHTAAVGSYRPNAFGLYDMLGNVWEWTCSAYTARYDGTETTCGGQAGYRVYRGGSWGNEPDLVRAALRGREDPETRDNGIGFRLAHD